MSVAVPFGASDTGSEPRDAANPTPGLLWFTAVIERCVARILDREVEIAGHAYVHTPEITRCWSNAYDRTARRRSTFCGTRGEHPRQVLALARGAGEAGRQCEGQKPEENDF